ncbi:unnamed protein product [Meloidogyne enterolobii]|uniref:Uncharacterized protein n=1 Tax=Meloidogyne enterolobii TaxID=390850 RepID=A0ACB0XX67_MELEN
MFLCFNFLFKHYSDFVGNKKIRISNEHVNKTTMFLVFVFSVFILIVLMLF